MASIEDATERIETVCTSSGLRNVEFDQKMVALKTERHRRLAGVVVLRRRRMRSSGETNQRERKREKRGLEVRELTTKLFARSVWPETAWRGQNLHRGGSVMAMR